MYEIEHTKVRGQWGKGGRARGWCGQSEGERGGKAHRGVGSVREYGEKAGEGGEVEEGSSSGEKT